MHRLLTAPMLVLMLTMARDVSAQADPPQFPPPPHDLMLLGTFHFADAGLDEFKPQVDVDITSEHRQRELEEVLNVLAEYQPTRIAVEVMPSRQALLDQQFGEYVRGEFELPANEVYQLGFRLAAKLGHDRVYAIDAERRWYEPYVNPEDYARQHGQGHIVDSPWYDRYRAVAEYEDRAKADRTIGQTLLALNDPQHIERSHGIYLVGTFKAGVDDAYPGVDVKTAWYNRNLRMFANIQRITESEHERILVIVGAGHLPLLRHCARTSPEYNLVEVASLVEDARPQRPAVVDAQALLRQHTFELTHGKRLGGPGLDLLRAETDNAQFVLLGEPHNTDQVNGFTAQLLQELHDQHGFKFLVTEQDGVVMDRLQAQRTRGNLKAIRAFARQHPDALHFQTDAELELLARVGEISGADRPIWGVDRVLDARLALESLLSITESEADKERIRTVLNAAIIHQKQTDSRGQFISSQSDLLDKLLDDLHFAPGTPTAELVHALRVSRDDLMAYQTEHAPDEPWGHEANVRREELMKARFIDCYRRAVDDGHERPRAIAKLGHWHITRGHNPGGVPSLGNFLTEVARFNGMDALSINIQPVNVAGRHWSITDYPDYDFFDVVADPKRWQLVDLRPLRGYVHAGLVRVTGEVRDLIFGFDMLLLMGGTDRGRATWDN